MYFESWSSRCDYTTTSFDGLEMDFRWSNVPKSNVKDERGVIGFNVLQSVCITAGRTFETSSFSILRVEHLNLHFSAIKMGPQSLTGLESSSSASKPNPALQPASSSRTERE